MQINSEYILKIQNLTYKYPGYNTLPKNALENISLNVKAGEKILVTGPSGSGKSSLLKCINGLIPHSDKNGRFEGDVFICGKNTKNQSVAEISKIVGTVFQNPEYQIISGNVDSEIAFGLENLCVPPEEIESRINEIAKLLKITHLLNRETSDLSWGEKQKVAIASVLVMQPKLIILDEPFSGLDNKSSESLSEILDNLNQTLKITLIIVEHRIETTLNLINRAIVLKNGKIIFDNQPCKEINTVLKSQDVILSSFEPNYDSEKKFTHPCKSKASFEDCKAAPPEQQTRSAVVIKNLCFSYPGSPNLTLDNISLSINNSEITFFLGSNGSGKSTLAKHLNRILKPDSGYIFLYGEDICMLQKSRITKITGLVSQHADAQLFGENITEEFEFGAENTGHSREDIEKHLPEIITALCLNHIDKNSPLLRLSVGEKQRIAIGSVLMMYTPVIVLDEPTIGLDCSLKRNLAEVLKKLSADDKCIIVMTHDLEFASSCADRMIVIDKGRIISDSEKHGDFKLTPRQSRRETNECTD